jgi:hypothetical protein
MANAQYIKVMYDFVDDGKGDLMLIIEAPEKGRADDNNAKLVYDSGASEALLYRNSEQIIQLPIVSDEAHKMLSDGRKILLVTEMNGDDINDVYEAKIEFSKISAMNKKIEIENSYDILQNKDGDFMFSVLEREGEPDNPKLVYDGGDHALLHRNGGHVVILDYINPDVRQPLTKTKEVLIGEHSKKDKKNYVREYVAAVKIVKRLPEEYDLLISKHEEETEKDKFNSSDIDVPGDDDTPEQSGERVRLMLKQDPKEAKRVAQFYTDMANDGNPAAQYELSNFYLEGIGVEKDKSKAKEWLEKAAKQGHKEAIKLLSTM